MLRRYDFESLLVNSLCIGRGAACSRRLCLQRERAVLLMFKVSTSACSLSRERICIEL